MDRVKLAREFRGAEPAKGEPVAVECGVRTYARYDKRASSYTGEAGYELTGFARVPDVERLLGADAAAV